LTGKITRLLKKKICFSFLLGKDGLFSCVAGISFLIVGMSDVCCMILEKKDDERRSQILFKKILKKNGGEKNQKTQIKSWNVCSVYRE